MLAARYRCLILGRCNGAEVMENTILIAQACACSRETGMSIFKLSLSSMQRIATVPLVATLAMISGCYVVPIDIRPGQAPAMQAPTTLPPAPGPITFAARLYPANDLASRYGVIYASVTNELNGKGIFTTNVNGEVFVGEATRKASSRGGIASGSGNRGSYLSCEYAMNSPSQGTGQCRLSDGAQFTMHMGS